MLLLLAGTRVLFTDSDDLDSNSATTPEHRRTTLKFSRQGSAGTGVLSNSGGGSFLSNSVGPANQANQIGSSDSTFDSYSYSEHRQAPEGTAQGQCGLMNLGNTCFMASGLQSLSRAEPLKRYFLSGRHTQELNVTNPLGNKGRVASEYAVLVQKLFEQKDGVRGAAFSSISPRDFKREISEFAPQFSGYQQQDSQELLMWLLDGLHEDLNRIVDKPATEAPEGGQGVPDHEVARQAWVIHKKRNDSIIVDLFQGQYKSTVTCPNCPRVSVTFDPFLMLTVPLPVEKTMICPVTVIWRDGKRQPSKFQMTVVGSTFDDLLVELAAKTGIAQTHLAVVQVYNNKIYKFYEDTELLSKHQKNDVMVAYELGQKKVQNMDYAGSFATQEEGKRPETIVTVFQAAGSSTKSNCTAVCTYPPLVATPLLYLVNKEDMTLGRLYECVDEHVRRLVSDQLQKWTLDHQNGTLRASALTGSSPGAPSQPAKIRKVGDPNAMFSSDRIGSVHNTGDDSEDIYDEPESPVVEVKVDDLNVPLAGATTVGEEPYTLTICGNDGSTLTTKVDLRRDSEQVLTRFNECFVVLRWDPDLWCNYIKNGDAVDALMNAEAIVEEPVDDDETESSGPIQLHQCIEKYLGEEQLGEDNQWYCKTCDGHKRANKKIDLWSLPEILIISLKRFAYTRNSRDKIDDYVEFPLEGLDMATYCAGPAEEPQLYDLFAVSNHFGGLGGGHYTAYAINAGHWVDFDDSTATPVSPEKVRSSAAYVLFYRRRSEAARDWDAPAGGVVSPRTHAMARYPQGSGSGGGRPGAGTAPSLSVEKAFG